MTLHSNLNHLPASPSENAATCSARTTSRRMVSGCRVFQGECTCCHRPSAVQRIEEGDRVFEQCQACREARVVWSDTLGRWLTVQEVESVMTSLVLQGPGFPSIQALIRAAVADQLIRAN